MPCSVGPDEIEYYEKRANQKNFGVEWTNAQLTETVACALGKLIKEKGFESELPKYVLGWLKAHEIRDSKRIVDEVT